MPNPNYLKGIRKERRLVNQARKEGLIALRSAGSHSPIDVVIIDQTQKVIRLIQCKPDSLSGKKKEALEEALISLNDNYKVEFTVE